MSSNTPRGGRPWDSGSVAVLYGMSPEPWSPRATERTYQPVTPPAPPPLPTGPESADALRARIQARVEWLENELRMHEAWRQELATLKRWLDAEAKENPTT